MTRLTAALATLLLIAASCAHVPPAGAAPLILTGHMPAFENAGTCASPVLVAAVGDATWRAVVSWAGPVSGADSTYALPGAAFSLTKILPSGTYTIRAHAAKGAATAIAGCDTTVVKVITNAPNVVALD